MVSLLFTVGGRIAPWSTVIDVAKPASNRPNQLREAGVTAFRFVDDLFLGARRVIEEMMDAFVAEGVGEWARWDATGRINVLHRASDPTLDSLAGNELREVALGIESGSERMLRLIDKRIDPFMTRTVVRRLTERGINVKGYFILGFPTETREEIDATVRLVHELWSLTDPLAGQFRASVFEYWPYPGTPDWHRLMATGRYTPDQLLDYSAIDLTGLRYAGQSVTIEVEETTLRVYDHRDQLINNVPRASRKEVRRHNSYGHTTNHQTSCEYFNLNFRASTCTSVDSITTGYLPQPLCVRCVAGLLPMHTTVALPNT